MNANGSTTQNGTKGPTSSGIRSSLRSLSNQADANKSYEQLKQGILNKLYEHVDQGKLNALPEERRRTELRPLVERLIGIERPVLSLDQQAALLNELLDHVLGFGPLERLLRDPTISDILVNGPQEVYVERRGNLEASDVQFRDNSHVLQIIDRILSKVGRRIDESSPLADARLPDGSRFNAIIPPLALGGPTLSIRRFGSIPLRFDDLLRNQMFTKEMAVFLEASIKGRLSVVISGGTGSGKTTLLNTLSSFIPNTERIITIEDAAELRLQQRHVVRLETRPPNIEGKGEITAQDLVCNALRMRPDRIIVGECRGAEAMDMLDAMNTGHEGSLTTLHANRPRDALSRLETMIMRSGLELSMRAMRQHISSAVDLIIQVNRLQGGVRKITCITEVRGMEQDIVTLRDIFRYQQSGVDKDGQAQGQFLATGDQPEFLSRLEEKGIKLPTALFQERVLLPDA